MIPCQPVSGHMIWVRRHTESLILGQPNRAKLSSHLPLIEIARGIDASRGSRKHARMVKTGGRIVRALQAWT